MSDERGHADSGPQTQVPYAQPYAPAPSPAAPPTSPAPFAMPYAAAFSRGGVWRDRKYLVVHKTAQLPDICVKSGEPAEGYKLKRSLYWHHPAIYLILLINLLIYVIVALIVRERALIHIGLSKKYRWRRRYAILLGWSGCLGWLVLSIYLFNTNTPALGSLGLIAFLVWLIGAKVMAQMVSPRRIDKEYVWLRGVCPAYLAMFPEWPYPS